MDKLLLKEVILEQQDFIKDFEEGVERQLLMTLSKYFKLPHILVIAGIRRVGSTLLVQIMRRFFRNSYYYFNFEDERLLNFEPNDFNNLYELMVELFGEKKVFFLDE